MTEIRYSHAPKAEGLWVRVTTHAGDVVEGVIPNDLLALSTEAANVTLITRPERKGPGRRRVHIVRQQIAAFEILQVLGSPLNRMGRAVV